MLKGTVYNKSQQQKSLFAMYITHVEEEPRAMCVRFAGKYHVWTSDFNTHISPYKIPTIGVIFTSRAAIIKRKYLVFFSKPKESIPKATTGHATLSKNKLRCKHQSYSVCEGWVHQTFVVSDHRREQRRARCDRRPSTETYVDMSKC